MKHRTTATMSSSSREIEDSHRKSLTLSQRLTLAWSAIATVLVLVTGSRLAVDGWWSLVVAWLEWPYPGWLNVLTTVVGIAIALVAWSWRDRVEGVWRGATLTASALAAAVSLFLIACAVLALIWLIWCLVAGDDDESNTYQARAPKRRGKRRRRPHRPRY
ncbi:hypothetical protein [Candidatus Poriferisodalis sp.]|uniref:hypothetical protein n=1 Tax=Candidatus Poriferisodalis sp. TaxID=3101277 RepID=UPI003B51B921